MQEKWTVQNLRTTGRRTDLCQVRTRSLSTMEVPTPSRMTIFQFGKIETRICHRLRCWRIKFLLSSETIYLTGWDRAPVQLQLQAGDGSPPDPRQVRHCTLVHRIKPVLSQVGARLQQPGLHCGLHCSAHPGGDTERPPGWRETADTKPV